MGNFNHNSSSDKVVLITGASAGIGRELALACSRRGMRPVLVARRQDRLEQLAEECLQAGASDAWSLSADVGARESCVEIVQHIEQRWGSLDILFNNAGFAVSSDLADLADISKFERVMDVNFRAAMWLTHAALPMLKKASGRICGISSVAGLFSMGGSASYNASKFAMRGFFDALRQELRGTGVSVTMIYPGFVVTEFISRVQDAEGNERGRQALSFYKPHMMSAERCAQISLNATMKRKREKVFTVSANLARWLQLVAPGALDYFVDRYRRKKIKRRAEQSDG